MAKKLLGLFKRRPPQAGRSGDVPASPGPEPRKITKEEYQSVRIWIHEKTNGKFACSVCGLQSWWIGEAAFAFGSRDEEFLPYSCTHCGHTLWFKASVKGVLEQQGWGL